MILKQYAGFCLCGEADCFPPQAQPVRTPFAPLVFLVRRDGLSSRGLFAISSLDELYEPEGLSLLRPVQPCAHGPLPDGVAQLVEQAGATVLNVTFARAFEFLQRYFAPSCAPRVNLVGLGDVGGTVLTGLKLLGTELAEIGIYDPNAAQCARYEMELNQILPLSPAQKPVPVAVREEAELFDCDLLLFAASRGVPPVGSGVQDVRMAQYEANCQMLEHYARRAREARFGGIFCQISDPVDQLARAVFLQSSRDAQGAYDFAGLLPEQVQGFGLGVMEARAAYYAQRSGVDFSHGRVYGPHGVGLIAANSCGPDYDDAASRQLTELTRQANLQVRALGFKPYIAPGLSSAAISILQLLRGELHDGAVPLGGAYFGCRSRMTSRGPALQREPMCDALWQRLDETWRALQAFPAP